MLSSPRMKEILSLVMEPADHTADELAAHFDVTVRTIRSDIQGLNRMMQGAVIILRRGKGYELQVEDPAAFDAWKKQALSERDSLPLDSMEDRQRTLLALLLMSEDWQDADDLADLIYVSHNTVQSYLRNIRSLCQEYDLVFESRGQQGVRISGPEEKRQECLCMRALERNVTDYVTGFSSLETRLFSNVDLAALSRQVYKRLRQAHLRASDYALKNIVIHTAVMVERISQGAVVEAVNGRPLPDEAVQAASLICEDVDILVPEPERKLLGLHIALNTRLEGVTESEDLRQRISALLDHIWNAWGFDLREDAVLRKDLYNHFFSIFQARGTDSRTLNPLLNTIKKSFPLAYDISLDAVNHVFHSEGLSEDEVGYISLHIGAGIERCYSARQSPVRVFLVCGSGMATARMLEARLKTYFQSKLEVLGVYSYQQYLDIDDDTLGKADFVISTVELPERCVSSVVVDFALSRKNVENITRMLAAGERVSQGPKHFFEKDLFMRFTEPVSKEYVLDMLCQKLVQAGIADDSLRMSVGRREELSHTNLNEVFAIPHPMTPQASRTRAAVAILDHPVYWNETGESVQIVFLLAFCQGEQQNIEHLYDFLLEIVQSSSLQQQIIQSKTFEEFHELCVTHSA